MQIINNFLSGFFHAKHIILYLLHRVESSLNGKQRHGFCSFSCDLDETQILKSEIHLTAEIKSQPSFLRQN